MNIEHVAISKLKPAKYNPRKLTDDQFNNLKDSLHTFGFVQPVVTNKNKTIIGGHMRVRVWKAMGHDTAPCLTVDLPEDKERELNIRLNKNQGEWDWDVLAAEFGLGDLAAWGFTTQEINSRIKVKTKKNEDVTPVAVPTITKTGDYYELGKHRIMCGDSTNAKDVERLMCGMNVDMIFTDPPCNVDYSGKGKNTSNTIANDNLTPEQFEEFLAQTFARYAEVAPHAIMYCCYASTTHSAFETAIVGHGYDVRNQIIWVKKVASFGWGDYRWKHEPIFYCVPKGKTSNFYGDRKQYTTWEQDKTDEELLAMIKSMITKDESGQSTVWRFNRDQNYDHPTQKPVELIKKALNNSSKRGGVVLDLFMGSGSTLIACESMERIAYGMEISPHYVDVIVQRYVDFCKTNGIEYTITRNGEPCNDFA